MKPVEKDPLALGDKETWAIYTSTKLRDALKKRAAKKGYKLSPYVEELLIAALRLQEAADIAGSTTPKP